jgi:hypothetical protein
LNEFEHVWNDVKNSVDRIMRGEWEYV